MEDESELRQEAHEGSMADLDRAIADQEQKVTAAEDYLDQALFLLGEECYQERIPDRALDGWYLKLDQVK
jgi:hypothetical protein